VDAAKGSTPLMTLRPRHYHTRIVRHYHTPIPRDGAIIFRDMAGELEVLRVECDELSTRTRNSCLAQIGAIPAAAPSRLLDRVEQSLCAAI
jgi:hypothetical protein